MNDPQHDQTRTNFALRVCDALIELQDTEPADIATAREEIVRRINNAARRIDDDAAHKNIVRLPFRQRR